jgi:hypothetical protein
MSDTGDEGPWLTISEAAERTGRKLDAMRALVRRGRLPRKKGNRGEWLVQIPGMAVRPALDPDSDGDLDPDVDGDSDSELAVLREQMTKLRIGLARAEERTTAAEREVELLRELLASERERHHDALAAAKAIAAAKEAAAERVIDALNQRLAELRRPWWRRMLSG